MATVPGPPPATLTATPATTPPPIITGSCLTERARLRTSKEGPGYVTIDPGSDVIAWKHSSGPLTTLVVGVNCASFSPDKLSPDSKEPVQEFTVRGARSWVIGDASTGHLELSWNADNGTNVIVIATVQAGADPVAATQELLTFGNTLVD